jgi:hypothetical protein
MNRSKPQQFDITAISNPLFQMNHQHELGQHYSIKADQLMDGMSRPPQGAIVLEPFAGQGDLLTWLGPGYINVAYDLEPKAPGILRRNTLLDAPRYSGAYVLTNPPWLAKNKSEDKTIFDRYGTDDLYKCFLKSLMREPPMGGIIIIPLNFLSGARDSEKKRRQEFFRMFKPTRFNIFEEAMFEDTDYLTLVIEFQRRIDPGTLSETWPIHFYPSNTSIVWSINKNILDFPNEDPFAEALTKAPPSNKFIKVRRHTDDVPLKPSETLTNIILENLDSGTSLIPGVQRIGLRIKSNDEEAYVGKATGRSRAQIVVRGFMSKKLQAHVVKEFNTWIENWREKTRSMFLPIFREAKEYPRRRMTFELAFTAISRILWQKCN